MEYPQWSGHVHSGYSWVGRLSALLVGVGFGLAPSMGLPYHGLVLWSVTLSGEADAEPRRAIKARNSSLGRLGQGPINGHGTAFVLIDFGMTSCGTVLNMTPFPKTTQIQQMEPF